MAAAMAHGRDRAVVWRRSRGIGGWGEVMLELGREREGEQWRGRISPLPAGEEEDGGGDFLKFG